MTKLDDAEDVNIFDTQHDFDLAGKIRDDILSQLQQEKISHEVSLERIAQLERELAAERKRTEVMHRRAQKAEGKCLRLQWWHRVISGIAKHEKQRHIAQYARAGLDGSKLHMGSAWDACATYWRRETRAELAAEKALADRLYGYYLEAIPALKLTRRNVSLVNDMVNADAAYRKARGL